MLPQVQSPFLVLIDIFVIFITFLCLKKSLRSPYVVSQFHYKLAIVLCCIFCLFSFWGTDWFHYQESFPNLKMGYKISIEDVYVWIAKHLSPNYIFFRLVIWGSALILFLKIIERLSVSKELVLLFFGCIYIVWFSYGRVSLSMALLFYGFSLLNNPFKNKLMSYILGGAIILTSFYFHKSSIFGISATILVVIIQKYPQKFLLLLIVLYPIIIIILRSQITLFLLSDIAYSDNNLSDYMLSGQGYMNNDIINRGVGAKLQTLLEGIPYFLIAFIGFKVLRSKLKQSIPYDIRSFVLLQIIIVVFSSVFAFDLGANTNLFYIRFLRFGGIPTAIVMAYLYQNRLYWKITRITVFIAALSMSYTLLYSFYNALLKG